MQLAIALHGSWIYLLGGDDFDRLFLKCGSYL